ncbi:hypothetical protein HYT00_01525 [Candidatus Giovannonibacteria bacterium]|nr:hypothetical protein [Candidatus Giovannonibacteria bacterium]
MKCTSKLCLAEITSSRRFVIPCGFYSGLNDMESWKIRTKSGHIWFDAQKKLMHTKLGIEIPNFERWKVFSESDERLELRLGSEEMVFIRGGNNIIEELKRAVT